MAGATVPSEPPPAMAKRRQVPRKGPIRVMPGPSLIEGARSGLTNPEARTKLTEVLEKNPRKEKLDKLRAMPKEESEELLRRDREELTALAKTAIMRGGATPEMRIRSAELSERIEMNLHKNNDAYLLVDTLARLAGFKNGLRVNGRKSVSSKLPDVVNLSPDEVANIGRRFNDNPSATVNGAMDELQALYHQNLAA
jgi:hypothetical protein